MDHCALHCSLCLVHYIKRGSTISISIIILILMLFPSIFNTYSSWQRSDYCCIIQSHHQPDTPIHVVVIKVVLRSHKEMTPFFCIYLLSFATQLYPLLFKVWVAYEENEEDLEKASIPCEDVHNILEEVRLRDERSSKRCKAWLCLPAEPKLKADILFPACEFDCRLNIRTSKSQMQIC